MQRFLPALVLTTLLCSTHAFAATIHPYWSQSSPSTNFRTTPTTAHPVWGTVTPSSQFSSATRSLGHAYYDQQSTASISAARMKDRLCERVQRRFGSNQTMLARVNARLKDRFGYMCDARSSTSTLVTDIEQRELRLALAPFHPVGDTVAKGASRIPVLSVVFSASCASDVTMEDVHITNFGRGLVSDISALWMMVDGNRVSRVRTLSRNKDVQLRFIRPFTIPACGSKTIEFFAATTTSALSSAQHTFSIDSSDHIFTDADVTGDFPIVGQRFTISSGKAGTLSVQHLSIDENPRVDGTDHEVLGHFSVSLDTAEDQILHSITIEQDGTIDDGDILGMYLRSSQGHARLTKHVEYTQNNIATFMFDPPQPIERGQMIELDVVGNIVWNTGATIQMGVRESVDLYAVGSRYGYGRNGQKYGSYVIIEGGEPARVRIR